MQPRALIVHTSANAGAEIRDNLEPLVRAEVAATTLDALRRIQLGGDYSVVIIDHREPLDVPRIVTELVAAQPETFIVLMTSNEQEGREFDQAMTSRVFRFFAGPNQRWQLSGIVSEGLRLQKLEREQKELIKKLSTEYSKLQRREKLLDTVVKERTRELQIAYDSLKTNSRQALLSFAEAIEAKDPYTKGHCGRTSVYSVSLGREVGLSPDELEVLEFGAFLHDIGKIGVRDSVLLKPGALDDEEWKHMKIHPAVGSTIASQLDLLKPIIPCIRNHHERWSGGGYPDNLVGEQIPLLARIVAIGDAYDAMATDRPYKASLPVSECTAIFQKAAGAQFDPELVDVFIKSGIMETFR